MIMLTRFSERILMQCAIPAFFRTVDSTIKHRYRKTTQLNCDPTKSGQAPSKEDTLNQRVYILYVYVCSVCTMCNIHCTYNAHQTKKCIVYACLMCIVCIFISMENCDVLVSINVSKKTINIRMFNMYLLNAKNICIVVQVKFMVQTCTLYT